MKKWLLRVIYYLTGFMMLSSIHCLVVGIVSGGSAETFLHSIIYFPAIIMLSEGQKQAKYFWQYAIVALGTVAITRIVLGRVADGSFEQILGTVLVVIAAALYFYARAKKNECFLEAPEYYYLAIYFLMWFLERQYPSELLEKYAVFGAGCYLLLCMYKTNIDEILQFIDLNGNLERFPEKRLLKSNLLMMGFQTVIVGCGMGIILSSGVDGIFRKLAETFRRFMEWLLRFLENDVEAVGSEVSGGTVIMPVVEVEERSAFMEMLLKLCEIMSWVIVIGLTIFVVYKLLKKCYQLYLEFDLNSAENGDAIEQIYTVQTKDEKRKLKKQNVESLRWDRSPNARIRKHYKKRVLQNLKHTPEKYKTPEEIEKDIVMKEKDKRMFHLLYEQARYGNEACTRNDVEKMIKF